MSTQLSFRVRTTALVCVLLALLLAFSLYYLTRPKPFTDCVPADSLGYFEIPQASRVYDLIHDPAFLNQAVGKSASSHVRQLMDSLLPRFNVSRDGMNHLQFGAIITSAAVESDQTIKVHGVLLLRVDSYFFREFHQTSRKLAEELADSNSFISTESIRGQEMAVLSRSDPSQQIFILVHKNAILLSNQREALIEVLATLDGAEPSISTSSTWKVARPHFSSSSVVTGFFVGASAVNLLRDFLTRNYSSFEDAGRTAKFLGTLGLDRIQSITYEAQKQTSGIQESWNYRLEDPPSGRSPFLNLFISQKGDAPRAFLPGTLPPDATGQQWISLKNSDALWRAFSESLGVLTQQESPQNRQLMISIFEGALGFRIQRDLLRNISDTVVLCQIQESERRGGAPSAAFSGMMRSGWLLILKARDRAGLQRVLSRIVSEDRPPRSMTEGTFTVFFSGLGRKPSSPLSGVMEGLPAFAARGDVFYFSPDRELLLTALRSFQEDKPSSFPALPPSFDHSAAYLSFTAHAGPETPGTASVSQLTAIPGGFQYLRNSSCGFLCDVIGLSFQGIQ